MKVAALTLMKNEADILPYKLKYMENQVDYYLFLDNESEDESLKIVSQHPKTVFCDVVKVTYNTLMRDILIEKVQNFIGEEDWFVYIDPDEIPFFNIKEKLHEIQNEYNCVVIHRPFFFFTKEMKERWDTDELYRKKIRNFDIHNYTYFAQTDHAEIRIAKNVKQNGMRLKLTKLKVPIPTAFPKKVYNKDLYFGHYQYRNPDQMKIRLKTRKNAVEKGSPSFHFYPEKWGLKDWDYRKLFIPEKKLIRYDYNQMFTMKGLKLKKMNSLFYSLFNPKKIINVLWKRLLKK
jgi:hypothetical protein